MGDIADIRNDAYYDGKKDAYEEIMKTITDCMLEYSANCMEEDLGYVQACRDVSETIRFKRCHLAKDNKLIRDHSEKTRKFSAESTDGGGVRYFSEKPF